ncbi:MAG: hypothetical protein Q9204_008842 [Flavoplaca sp. TL-2023a]
MPAYLCHICTTYNPFPSPLCANCTHPYCIICLPIIPQPHSFQPSSLDSSTSYNSSISSFTLEEEELKDEDIIREFLSIHPAHRFTRPPSPIEVMKPKKGSLPELPTLEDIGKEVVVTTATQCDSPTLYHPVQHQPPPPTPPLLPRKSSQTLPPTSNFLSVPKPLKPPTPTAQPPRPTPHTPDSNIRPTITRTTTSPLALAPPLQKSHHKRHSSIPDIIVNEGDHLRRTMSAQGEKVSRLVRKGSMRLRGICGRGTGV